MDDAAFVEIAAYGVKAILAALPEPEGTIARIGLDAGLAAWRAANGADDDKRVAAACAAMDQAVADFIVERNRK